MVATWSSRYGSGSPSFQLCLSGTQECGEAVWPNVKRLGNGTYSITMAIPELGGDNAFFIRMEDDDGDISETPTFKLQVSPDRAPSSGSASGSSSATPGSSPPSHFGSSLPSSGGDDDGAKSESDKGDEDEVAGQERPSGIYTRHTSASSLPVATGSATLSLLPSATNRALVATTDNGKPSTVAIVVPLAIFAAALAGLIFSLRQRSKTRREIERRKGNAQGDPSLSRTTSKESSSAASEGSAGSAEKTDLERAMEFISGVQVPKSPTLTPLPPSIESKRRARMENKLKQGEASQGDRAMGTGIQTTGAHIPQAAGRPAETSHMGSYYGHGFPHSYGLHQLPTIPRAVPLIAPSTYAALVSGSGFRPEASQGIPPGFEPRGSILSVELPRPSAIFQPQGLGPLPYPVEQHYQSPAPTAIVANQDTQAHMHLDAGQPVEFAPPIPAPIATSVQMPIPLPPVALGAASLPPPPVLPASLRVARPQTPSPQHGFGDEPYAGTAQLHFHESAPLPAGPSIPYTTRPPTSGSTTSNTLTSLPDPYAAIAMALHTDRHGGVY